MNAATERLSVEREITIAATPETVWELLTDPEEATRWMGQAASFDLRPGGTYRVDVIPGDTVRGEFVEIDRPRRLVYTWGWERGSRGSVPPGSTTVEFELVPDGAGTCCGSDTATCPTTRPLPRTPVAGSTTSRVSPPSRRDATPGQTRGSPHRWHDPEPRRK